MYTGDATFASAGATLIQTSVSDARPVSTLTLSTSQAPPWSTGKPLTVTATVTGSGTPTGTVQFDAVGAADVVGPQSATLNGAGVATFTVTPNTDELMTLTAGYGGDGANTPAAATVSGAAAHFATTTVLTLPTLHAGQPNTYTATVTATGGTPTGSVHFYDTLGGDMAATLSAGGVATFTAPPPSAGAHAIWAIYEGDGHSPPVPRPRPRRRRSRPRRSPPR